MNKPSLEPRRKSHIDQGELYFWTATINKWQRLLEKDEYKNVIIQSLQFLTDENKVDVFAFIIMPNKEHWDLVKHPCDYKFSSARYYEMNEKNFSFLKDLWEVVGRL